MTVSDGPAAGRARPPSQVDPSGELRDLASDCVHCGFCLPVCPTYQLWGEEMDSPRGRILLITELLDGAQASPTAAAHIDRCLGCMACVPACPSGVRYDRLIEAARSWTEEPPAAAGPGAQPGPLPARSLRDRAVRAAIFQTFPYPGRLRVLTRPLRAAQRTGLDRLLERSGLAGRLAPELAAALRLAPPPGGPARRPRRAAAGGRPTLSPRTPGPRTGAPRTAGPSGRGPWAQADQLRRF